MAFVWNCSLGRYVSTGGGKKFSSSGHRRKKVKHQKPFAGLPKGMRMILAASHKT